MWINHMNWLLHSEGLTHGALEFKFFYTPEYLKTFMASIEINVTEATKSLKVKRMSY